MKKKLIRLGLAAVLLPLFSAFGLFFYVLFSIQAPFSDHDVSWLFVLIAISFFFSFIPSIFYSLVLEFIIRDFFIKKMYVFYYVFSFFMGGLVGYTPCALVDLNDREAYWIAFIFAMMSCVVSYILTINASKLKYLR